MSLTDEILNGSIAGVKQLLAAGENPNKIDKYGYRPLTETAIINNVAAAELLLKAGAIVDLEDIQGCTALYWAVDNGNVELARLLLKNGANPNIPSGANQPMLVMPLLRRQTELKQLLYKHGVHLNFAKDFINAKLIGHRFELAGATDIVDYRGHFVEIDFEGFYPEFTLAAIADSLYRFINNFSARPLKHYFDDVYSIIDALQVATHLRKFRHYLVDIKKHEPDINPYLDRDPLIIPVTYMGHAITYIRYGEYFAACDRGEQSKVNDTSVRIFRIGWPHALSKAFIRRLLYELHTEAFIVDDVPRLLGLEQIAELPVTAQVSGNCSWANVEACVPSLLFMMHLKPSQKSGFDPIEQAAMAFYHQWFEWEKDWALHSAIQSFHETDSKARQASYAAILGAILFQRCTTSERDLVRAHKILKILLLEPFRYVLKSYINAYCVPEGGKKGVDFERLLKLCDIDINQFRKKG